MTPLVSIVIPCYNAAAWLAATLESAVAQTWPYREIIVVDDGSTDDSITIAAKFAEHGVQLIRQRNAGAAAARNTALRAARGEYVQFLDADDLIAPEKIARQLAVLANAPSGTVAAGAWGRFAANPAAAHFERQPVWADHAPLDWLVASLSGQGMFPPIVWLTPRAVLDRAGPWDESLSLDDDGEYFARVLMASPGIRFVDGAVSYYRAHNGSRLSGLRGRRAAESSFRSIEKKQSLLFAAEDSTRTRHALACAWQRFVWEQLDVAPDLTAKAFFYSRTLAPDLPPPPGPRLYRMTAKLLGWRRARRLQRAWETFRRMSALPFSPGPTRHAMDRGPTRSR